MVDEDIREVLRSEKSGFLYLIQHQSLIFFLLIIFLLSGSKEFITTKDLTKKYHTHYANTYSSLNWLVSNGLIEQHKINNRSYYYKITDKGHFVALHLTKIKEVF